MPPQTSARHLHTTGSRALFLYPIFDKRHKSCNDSDGRSTALNYNKDSVRSISQNILALGFLVLFFGLVFMGLKSSLKSASERNQITAEYKICVGEAAGNPNFLEMCQSEKEDKLRKIEERNKK